MATRRPVSAVSDVPNIMRTDSCRGRVACSTPIADCRLQQTLAQHIDAGFDDILDAEAGRRIERTRAVDGAFVGIRARYEVGDVLSIIRGVFAPVPPSLTHPDREPLERRIVIDGVELCYFEWGHADVATAPTVLLVHATGFHGRCWDRVVDALPPDRHVISLDQRGHGRSAKVPPFNWASFGADLTGFVAALNLTRIVGVGHSLGGHVVVQATAAEQRRFERLVLVDPVIMDPALYASMKDAMGTQRPQDHPTSRRKNIWQSWQEMFERLQGRGSFAVWRRDVLEDYCRHGVLPNPDGPGFVLACPPLVEAAIYTGASGRDIHDLFGTIDVPVIVLRAEKRTRFEAMDFLASPTWEGLADQFTQGRDVYLPHLTHFIPMQDPELVARYIEGRDG